MKAEILQKLDLLLDTTNPNNNYHINLINSIKQDLINEWNASDYYAEEIKKALDIDVTYELLNEIKIR